MKPKLLPRIGTMILLVAAYAGLAPATQGQTLTVLHTFAGAEGGVPTAGLVRTWQGNIFGTTQQGGSYGLGTVYKLSPGGEETVLHSFMGQPDGQSPYAGTLIRDSLGNLYGTTVGGGAFNHGTVFKVDHQGNETVLYSFTGGDDGGGPFGGVIRDSGGNLYGVTYYGGSSTNYGAVYKVDPTGTETVLKAFLAPRQGEYSYAGLIQDTEGNLYGTTSQGGWYGDGMVFKLDTKGTESIEYAFKKHPDAQMPLAGVQLRQGSFYGTTLGGGAHGGGTIYKIDSTRTESVLYNFGTVGDGVFPYGGLVFDAKGNIYGTTFDGGAFGFGTIFKVDPNGNETVLYSFTGGADGANPGFETLVRDSAGNLYGTTSRGAGTGCGGSGCGTVFKFTP